MPEASNRPWTEDERAAFTQLGHQTEKALAHDPLFAGHAHAAFEVIEKIGQGGMGQVLRIHDRRLRRHAALKILNQDSEFSRRERFLREASIMARLDHPSIPAIYEAGKTMHGQLFLLMKLIEGRTLAVMIRQHHQQHRPRASLARLLEALVKTGEALAYAHSEGIIHRDVKPENIMIGRYGEVMLIDWGIARDLTASPEITNTDTETPISDERLTQEGSFLGTPGYMAPEQVDEVGGVLDGRADVFALGSILTEILTNAPAVDAPSGTELLAAVLAGAAETPRQRVRDAPRSLDSLAAAALRADPSERLASAELFVENLRAYQNNDPLPIHRYNLIERAAAAARRRPGALLGASALTLLIGISAALWTVITEQRQALERRSVQLNVSEGARQRAEDEEARSQRALSLLSRAKDLRRRGAPDSEVTQAVEAVLDARLLSFAFSMELAAILDAIGDRDRCRRILEEAAKRFAPAYEALFYLHELEVRGKVGLEISTMSKPLQELVRRAKSRGDTNAFTLLAAGIQEAKAERFKQAIRFFDSAEERSTSLVLLYLQRGAARFSLEHFEEATADFEAAIRLRPKSPWPWLLSAEGLRSAKRFPDALRAVEKALKLDPNSLLALRLRASIRFELTLLDQALADYEQILARGGESAAALINRGKILAQRGDRKAALADYQRAAILDPQSALAAYQIGIAQRSLGRLAKARAAYLRAIEIDPEYAEAHNNLGSMIFLLAAQLSDPERKAGYRKAIAAWDRTLEIDPEHRFAHGNRGMTLIRLGALAEAVTALKKSLEIDAKNPGNHRNLGDALRLMKKLRASIEAYNRAIELDPSLETSFFGRARSRTKLRDLEGALDDLDRAIVLKPDFGKALAHRSVILVQLGRRDQARVALKRALQYLPETDELRPLLKRLEQGLR